MSAHDDLDIMVSGIICMSALLALPFVY